jgi:glutaminyl-peptide cyclotransferase
MSKDGPAPAGKLSPQRIFLGAAVLLSCMLIVLMALVSFLQRDGGAAVAGPLRLADIPFDGARAFEHLKQLCALGPRPSASPGMAAQQKMLAAYFQNLGGRVEFQQFRERHPVDGSELPLANLLVQWHPQSKERILLCAHYDTLPLPMRDPVNPRGIFVGANDNASGVAVLMELGRQMAKADGQYGVDFLLFDGEEFIFTEQHRFFRGSEYFARDYVRNPPPYHYRRAVLLDMVGTANLKLYQESNSMSWRDTRPLVEEIWATAARLGVREFIPRVGGGIRDDHLALLNTAKIPACDIIDQDYMGPGQPWHTQRDTPERCSALSLAKVGWVLAEWLKTAREGKQE